MVAQKIGMRFKYLALVSATILAIFPAENASAQEKTGLISYPGRVVFSKLMEDGLSCAYSIKAYECLNGKNRKQAPVHLVVVRDLHEVSETVVKTSRAFEPGDLVLVFVAPNGEEWVVPNQNGGRK